MLHKYYKKNFKKSDFDYFILGGDIGATNANFCIAGIKKHNFKLLFSLHFKTKEIKNFNNTIKKVLDFSKKNHQIHPKKALIGAAGIVKNNVCQLFNSKLRINGNEISKNIKTTILNDFQLIGFAINTKNNNLIKVKAGVPNGTKAILGAGSGLGKSILILDHPTNIYFPIPSEGGHSDFSMYDAFDLLLSDFIKRKKQSKVVSWEDILSGRGLINLYEFVKQPSSITNIIDNSEDKPRMIFKYKNKDKSCKKTIELFSKYFGRCAKNFALDSLCTGGLYIAGGIAAKNSSIFKSRSFREEFLNSDIDLLKKIPIFIITNYDISLYGAIFAALI